MKYLAIITIMAFTGCAQLNDLQSKSADQVAKGIKEYCKQTDQDFRDKLRADINAKAAPHSIVVNCG